MRKAVAALLVLAALMALAACGDSGPTQTTAPTRRTAKLQVVVNLNGSSLSVTNKDSFEWTNVRFEINSRYVRKVDSVKAGATVKMSTADFTLSDGTRFSPATQKALTFAIWCDIPDGRGEHTGEWY